MYIIQMRHFSWFPTTVYLTILFSELATKKVLCQRLNGLCKKSVIAWKYYYLGCCALKALAKQTP